MFYHIPTKIHLDTIYFLTQKYKILQHFLILYRYSTVLPMSHDFCRYCVWVKFSIRQESQYRLSSAPQQKSRDKKIGKSSEKVGIVGLFQLPNSSQ